MRKKYFTKICTLLLTLAPIMAFKIDSGWLFGEAEIPKCMKEKTID